MSLAGGTHEVMLQGTTAESEPLYAGGRQPTLLGRLQNFWQLSRATYAQLGFTATGGNNADEDLRSRLLGLDFRFTYRPPESGNRQGDHLPRRGLPAPRLGAGRRTNRYGTFLDLQARRSQRWVFGARYDWVEAPRGLEDTEWRITPCHHLVAERVRLSAPPGRAPATSDSAGTAEPADAPGRLGHGSPQTRDVLSARGAKDSPMCSSPLCSCRWGSPAAPVPPAGPRRSRWSPACRLTPPSPGRSWATRGR